MLNFRIANILLALLIWEAAAAQNHDPSIEWQSLKTPRFSVHFPAEHAQLGRRIAALCEEAYFPVSRSLNYFPGRTHVVVHTRSDQANGFVTFLPWRMELFVAEPTDDFLGSRDSWLRILVTHEFTHIVQGRKVAGLSELTQPFFGELNTLWQTLAPQWHVEGIATFNETRLTRGGRGRNPFHLMKMLAPIQNRRPWRLEATNFISRRRAPVDMQYVAGYYLSEFARDRHGDEVWRRVADRFSAWPLLGFSHAFKHVTGESIEAVYTALVDSLIISDTAHPGPAVRPVLDRSGPENQYSPRWTASGDLVLYTESYSELPGIARIDRAGSADLLLQKRLATQQHGFDIRGHLLAWTELRPHRRYVATLLADAWILDLRSGQRRRITENARIRNVALRPNGRAVAAVQTVIPGTRLVKIDVDSGTVDVLLELPGSSVFNPAWSPDGRQIAFALKDSLHRQDIAVLDVASGEFDWITRDAAHDNMPAWTPDGRSILFSSDRSGRFHIWQHSIAQDAPVQVTLDPAGAFAPAVSHDGRTLAFSRYTEDGFRVVTMPFEPRAERATIPERVRVVSEPGVPDTVLQGAVPGPYRPLGQILTPNGWFPVALEDASGGAVGMFGFSADALGRHEWAGYAAFSLEDGTPSWDISYAYSRYWPRFSVRSFSEPEKFGRVRIDDAIEQSWLRRNGGELTLRAPLLLEQNVNTAFIEPSLRLRFEQLSIAPEPLRLRRSDYRGVAASVQMARGNQTLRDLVPRNALIARVEAEWSAPWLGSDFRSRHIWGSADLYIPALLKQHALVLQAAASTIDGAYPYDRIRAYPIGYGNPGGTRQLRLRASYVLPLAWPEWPVPVLPVFMQTLGATLFSDWGSYWAAGEGMRQIGDRAFGATGAIVFGDFVLSNAFRMRLGGAVFYRSADREWRVEPVFSVGF